MEFFSSKICQLCHADLESFHTFRRDLIQKQKRLYNNFFQSNENFTQKNSNEYFLSDGHDQVEVLQDDEINEEICDVKYEVEEQSLEGVGEECQLDEDFVRTQLDVENQTIKIERINENFICDK